MIDSLCLEALCENHFVLQLQFGVLREGSEMDEEVDGLQTITLQPFSRFHT